MKKLVPVFLIISILVISGCAQSPKACNYDDPSKDYVFRGWKSNECPIFDPADKPGWKTFSNECGCGYEKIQTEPIPSVK